MHNQNEVVCLFCYINLKCLFLDQTTEARGNLYEKTCKCKKSFLKQLSTQLFWLGKFGTNLIGRMRVVSYAIIQLCNRNGANECIFEVKRINALIKTYIFFL